LVWLVGRFYEYEALSVNGLRSRDILTKFREDRFTHLSNITVITATVFEAVMLVLLNEEILIFRVYLYRYVTFRGRNRRTMCVCVCPEDKAIRRRSFRQLLTIAST
jgi:hypothetical protein